MRTHWDRRENFIDTLRLLLCVAVLLSHSFALSSGSEAGEPLMRWTHGQISFGAISVDLFFVLSGFLITASMERSRSFVDFAKRRVLRIYPGFLVTACAGILVALTLAHATLLPSPMQRAGDFLLQTLRLREFRFASAFGANPYPNAINGSLWSIQYEAWCYVGTALLAALTLLRRPRVVALLFVASWTASWAWLHFGIVLGGKFLGVLAGSPQLWARMLPFYLAGTTFYLFRYRIAHSSRLALVSLGALVAASFVPHGWSLLMPFAGTYLVFFVGFHPRLGSRLVDRVGDMSYGAYLYGFLVQQVLVQQMHIVGRPWMLFLLATPITLLLAQLSWRWVESPCLQMIRRGQKRKIMVPALPLDVAELFV